MTHFRKILIGAFCAVFTAPVCATEPDYWAECTLKFASGKTIKKVNDALESGVLGLDSYVSYWNSNEDTLMSSNKNADNYNSATPSLRDLISVDGKKITNEEKKYLKDQNHNSIDFDCRGNGTYIFKFHNEPAINTIAESIPADYEPSEDSESSECTLTFANGKSLSGVRVGATEVLHGKLTVSNTGKMEHQDYDTSLQLSSIYYRAQDDDGYYECVSHNDPYLDVRKENYKKNTPHMRDLVSVNGEKLDAAQIEMLQKAEEIHFYCDTNAWVIFFDTTIDTSNTAADAVAVSGEIKTPQTETTSTDENSGDDATTTVSGDASGDNQTTLTESGNDDVSTNTAPNILDGNNISNGVAAVLNSGTGQNTNQQEIQGKKEQINNILAQNNINSEDIKEIKKIETEIIKLQKAYKDARENEKSLKNRMLGGLTMAATGIGGMQLAQGLAEQSADAAAERDMQAYLATFQCTAGGKTYSGGTSGIELAGANQLTSLYQQYVDLAADLKERKAALGMKAGIESEVILDKANTGLYDDVGKGIENGTYASLYRASKGNEKDVNKLAEQKNTSATRVKGGAIAAGAGAVGGIVGNMLINGDKKSKKDDLNNVVNSVTNKVTSGPTNVTPTDETAENDGTSETDETADNVSESQGAKLKECLDYIQREDLFDGVFIGGCQRLVLPVANNSVLYALSNDEAASLSPMWDWGCWNADSNGSRKVWLYGGSDRDYSEIKDEEKDACETVEKVKMFIAEHTKSCEEYENRVIYTETSEDSEPKNYCVQKDWLDAEHTNQSEPQQCEGEYMVWDAEKATCKVENKDKKRHTPCTEEDFAASQHTKNAAEGWYDNKKHCVAKTCKDGYTLALNAQKQSQGYCKKNK